MGKYFFKLVFRNIKKYRVNTLISLLGLTVGLASFILIASFLKHELSFNKYNEHYNRIFKAKIDFYLPDGVQTGGNMPYPLVEGLVTNFPEIKTGVRFSRAFIQVSSENDSFFENNGYYVDNSFFEIFTATFLSGDNKNPLIEPNTIVLTKSYAEKYFGKENPIGKTLLIDKNFTVKITAVIDNMPVNSDFRYDFFISFKTFIAINSSQDFTERWNNHQFSTFFLLEENCDYKKLNEKISGFLDPYKDTIKRVLLLSPLSMQHLKANNDDNSIKILIILGIVALFILITACINFINLSIANAANRIKETSIRRILGSNKSSLVMQQIGESLFLSFIAFDFAYLIAERSLPSFNSILQSEIPTELILNFSFVSLMFLVAMLLGFISGVFPAIKIGKIQPLRALSGRGSNMDKTGLGKKGLVVFQYTVSIVLIIATTILSQQFNYIKNKDLGFDGDYLITCYVKKVDNTSNPELKSFRDEMLRQSGVLNVSLSFTMPFYGNSQMLIRKENAEKEDGFYINYNITDMFFLETYGINLESKKDFSINSNSSEKGFCYINQSAADKLAYVDPIGEFVFINESKYEIVGVCDNYHIYSMQMKIRPQVDILWDEDDLKTYDNYTWMTIKCDAVNLNKVKELANKKLKEFLPDNPYGFFNYGDTEFRVEALNKVQGVEKIFGFFTIIAVLIACMGIFGLVALTVKHKTKEIGIRKTLGSSVFAIYKLIAREYLILTIIGNITAWFPAWYICNKILQDFAYRIDISFWVFVLGFISSVLLTIITIAFHTIKAATSNPVEALRYE